MFSTCEKSYPILNFLEIIFCRKVFCIDFEILPTNLASLEAIKEKQTNLKVLSLKTCVFNLWKKDLILEFLRINLNLDFKKQTKMNIYCFTKYVVWTNGNYYLTPDVFGTLSKTPKKNWNKFLTFLHWLDRVSRQACDYNFWSKKRM